MTFFVGKFKDFDSFLAGKDKFGEFVRPVIVALFKTKVSVANVLRETFLNSL